MGPFNRYRSYGELSDSEVRQGFRARAKARRAKELERVEALDLTGTTIDELPGGEVVAALSFAAKRALNRQPDRASTKLRDRLAALSGTTPERTVTGNGATGLLGALAAATLQAGDELVTPWPSYPLYPALAAATGADATPLPPNRDPRALAAAANAREAARILVLCNPNDPDGALTDAGAIAELRDALDDRILLVVDEALADYAGEAHMAATAALLDGTDGVILVRSMSKAWGLAGLRVGWMLSGQAQEPLLARLSPMLGVSLPAQAGALAALESERTAVERRVAAVGRERTRLEAALRATRLELSPSAANVIWLRLPGVASGELTSRLRTGGVLVMDGAAVGDDEHVRATIRGDEGATDRLIDALLAAAD